MHTELSKSEYKINHLKIDRRKLILDFILSNHGCSNKDIQDGLSSGLTITVISRIINDLIRDGIIQNKGGKNLNILIPVEDNEISFTEKWLLDFKQKYFILIAKVLESPSIKRTIKSISAATEEPTLDEKLITGKTLGVIYSEFKKSNEIYSMIEHLQSKILYNSDITSNEDFNNRNLGVVERTMSKSQMRKMEEASKKLVLDIEKYRDLRSEYSRRLKNSSYLALTSLPIFLFVFLSHYIILRSMFVWPKRLVSNKLIFELTELTNKILQEIKNSSIDFLARTKNNRMISEIENLMNDISLSDQDYFFRKIYCDLSILRMKKVAVDIIKSLNKFEGKDIGYDYEESIDKIYKMAKSISN